MSHLQGSAGKDMLQCTSACHWADVDPQCVCFLTCATIDIDDLDSHGGTVVPALIHLPKAALP